MRDRVPITVSFTLMMDVKLLKGVNHQAEKMPKFANIKIRLEMLKKLEKNYF
jgi:hypothetical protein